MPSSIPTLSPLDSLITLKSQYERSLTQATTKASHLREQLSHVNALLLNQLLQGKEVMPQLTQAEVAVVEAKASHKDYAPSPAAEAPTAKATASDRKPKATPRKAKAPAAQPKAKPTTAPAKSRRSLEVLPAYRGMSKREAIAQVLAAASGEVLHHDTIIQTLYGDLSLQDIKDERVRIKTLLLTGVKDGKWQKAFEPSSYFAETSAASSKANGSGRKSKVQTTKADAAIAPVKTEPATPAITTKRRNSLNVLPAFEGLSKLDAIAKVLAQHPGEVLHQDTIIQRLYGELSLEDLRKERVRMDTSLRNGVKNNRWKKAPIPASYVLEATASAKPKRPGRKPKEPTPQPERVAEVAPASASAKVAKLKLGRKSAGGNGGRSQKKARSKKTELELVELLRKADIQV